MHHWMFNCGEVTRLVSESLDRKLPLHQRMGIRIHLFMCKFCARYSKQLKLLRGVMRLAAEERIVTDFFEPLPSDAKTRIQGVLGREIEDSHPLKS